MRLVGNFDDENLAQKFSVFLESNKIENTLEAQFDIKKKQDIFNIWVHNEDQLSAASSYLDQFVTNPKDDRYNIKIEKKVEESPEEPIQAEPVVTKRSFPFKVTFFFLFLCVGIFFVNFFQEMNLAKKYNLKELILLTPIQISLLYDVPQLRVKLNDVIIKYKLDSLEKLENPPPEAVKEIEAIEKAPVFKGLYDVILDKMKNKKSLDFSAPLFEKIRQGQVWRLFTPAILHSGFLHILFNMLWLWYLGKQIEPRLKFLRYVLFILVVAIISNTVQYLMGGPFFLGFSGVIMGMAGYIWVRQKVAPWEGYPMPKAVCYFIAFFVLAMLALQIVSFVLQIFKANLTFMPGIANSAHIAGAIIGMVLAKIPFFAWRTSE